MPMRVYESSWTDKTGKPRSSTVFVGNVDEDKPDEDVQAEYIRQHPEFPGVQLVRSGTDNRTPKQVIEEGPRPPLE